MNQTARAPQSTRARVPAVATVSLGLFCATVATIGGGSWVGAGICQSRVLFYGVNPVLFALGFAGGAWVGDGVFRGRPPSLLVWALGWGGFWPVVWVVGMVTDRSYQGWGVLFALAAVVAAVPVGLLFGMVLMTLTRALAERFARVGAASADGARIGGEAAAWLLAAGAVKWVTQPTSWVGMSAVVAACAAAGLALRGRRPALVALAMMLVVIAMGVKIGWGLSVRREADYQALPPCWQALQQAAAHVPGVSTAATDLIESSEGSPRTEKWDVLVFAVADADHPSVLHDQVERALSKVACRENDAAHGSRMTYTVTVEPAACWAAVALAVKAAVGDTPFEVSVFHHANVGPRPALVESQTVGVKVRAWPDAGDARSALQDKIRTALQSLTCTDDGDPGFKVDTKYQVVLGFEP